MTRPSVPPPRNLARLVLVATLAVAAAAPAVDVTASKSIFARGKLHGSASGGWVSTSGDDYLQLGLGAGYNVADGLALGLDYGAWLLGDPTVHKLTPWAGYTFWQVSRIKPYVGAFLRQNWVDGFDSYREIGGRAGVALPRGRSYVGLGVVYEYRLSDGFADRDRFYPEARVTVGF